MSWWSGLDADVYVDLDEVTRRMGVGPELGGARWPPALRRHLTRPTAVLARHVASPSYETVRFVRLARRHGLQPLVIEHRSDRFTAHNPAKRSLATLRVVVGRSRNGQPIIRWQKVADLAAAEGRRLDEVVTRSGEGLIAYHHRKLACVLGSDAPRIVDLRDVVSSCAGGAGAYYGEFFRMLTGRLVLLEDFVADDQTAAFFQSTVLPAYRQAAADLGARPQIARLVPGRRTSSLFWYSYPAPVADDPSWVQRTSLPRPAVG